MDNGPGLALAYTRPPMTERLANGRAAAYPSCVTIDLGALASNIRWIKARVGGHVALMAVLKADAYGHGAAEVARAALQNGADLLAVANMAEALELREAHIDAPILLLSYVPAEAIPTAIAHGLSVTVFDEACAARCISATANAGLMLKVHVKVDTGMGRLGVLPPVTNALCRQLQDTSGIDLEGVYTHFATADDDPAYMREQLKTFNRVQSQLRRAGVGVKYIHAANSAALLNGDDSYFNVIRPGLLLYGLEPMPNSAFAQQIRPVMSWRTQIAQVKTLPPDSPVGYGRAYRTRGRETIAVAPVGYADGLRRTPYSWREVLIQGQRAPLAGRVSMEKITINVSHIRDVAVGDEVVLMGRQGDDSISADEIATWIHSNSYEVVTSIAPRVPRTYINR